MDDFISMGFEEDAIRSALSTAGGNRDTALEILLGGGIGGTPVMPVTNPESSDDETLIVLEISQYTFLEAGSSACTPIACSAVAAILERLDNNTSIRDASFLSDAIISGVANYSNIIQQTGASDHMSLEDFYNISQETKSNITQIGEPYQGLLTERDAFMKLLTEARQIASNCSANRGKHIGIVITKPPETVCITIPPLDSTEGSNLYSFFDSHSRPEFGIMGSYLVTSTDVNSITLRLNAIFPESSSTNLGDGFDGSYMQMLYSTFEGTVFQKA